MRPCRRREAGRRRIKNRGSVEWIGACQRMRGGVWWFHSRITSFRKRCTIVECVLSSCDDTFQCCSPSHIKAHISIACNRGKCINATCACRHDMWITQRFQRTSDCLPCSHRDTDGIWKVGLSQTQVRKYLVTMIELRSTSVAAAMRFCHDYALI